MINKDNVNNEVTEKQKSQWLPSKMMVIVRLLLGGYLIYTAYELINAIRIKEATNQLFNISFAIIFVLAGIILLFFSAKSLKTGKYIGGVLDQNIEKETDETKS